MFTNIEKKIKTLSGVLFWLEVCAAVIGAIALFSAGGGFAFIGVCVLIAGPFAAWVSACLMYGFGQLIENTRGGGAASPAVQEETAGEEETEKIQLPAGVQGKCDLCGAENLEVRDCVIQDQLGTRYRTLCRACMEKSGAKVK